MSSIQVICGSKYPSPFHGPYLKMRKEFLAFLLHFWILHEICDPTVYKHRQFRQRLSKRSTSNIEEYIYIFCYFYFLENGPAQKGLKLYILNDPKIFAKHCSKLIVSRWRCYLGTFLGKVSALPPKAV